MWRPHTPGYGLPKSPRIAGFGLFCGTAKFMKFHFFWNPSVASGIGLGDHLVTIWVTIQGGGKI